MRIVSLNTGRNEGNYADRLDVMAEGLRKANADIIFLQEGRFCYFL